MEVKKTGKGLKFLIIFLIIILIALCCVGYYGYNKYQNIKNDNKKMKSEISNLNKKIENLETENKSSDTINNSSANSKTDIDNNQSVNYTVIDNDKHIYGSDGQSLVYAINNIMYISNADGIKELSTRESDVNMVAVKESPQGTLAYVVKKDGNVIRYYDGSSFDFKNAFNNYKVKKLTINCISGEDGSCSKRTYTLTLLDGLVKTVNTDE